jgi:hypothetical protein
MTKSSSHGAIFVDESGNIVEALGGGVQKRNIAEYDDTGYAVSPCSILPIFPRALVPERLLRYSGLSTPLKVK